MTINTSALMPNWQRMRSSLLQQVDSFESGRMKPSFSLDKTSHAVAQLKSMIVNLDGLLEDYGAASRLYRRGAIRSRERVYG